MTDFFRKHRFVFSLKMLLFFYRLAVRTYIVFIPIFVLSARGKRKMETDLKYVEGLRIGSYRDFTRLYELYAPRLYAFVFSLTHSETMAKEVVQETFIRVWMHRAQLDPDQSFKAYLFTIAKNRLLNEFRRQVNRADFIKEWQSSLPGQPEENNIERKISLDEFHRCLQGAKKKLTPRQRELFEWNKEEGFSVPEIAEKTALAEQTVRNQLSAALRILRKEMSKYYLLFASFFFGS